MDENEKRIQAAETLLDILIARARGEGEDHHGYLKFRSELTHDSVTKDALPRFVSTCRNLDHFWRFIQPK